MSDDDGMMPDRTAGGPTYRVRRPARGMDPGTKKLALIAGGLGGLLLLVLAWSAVGHHGGGAVPVIQADSSPIRVKPANPGGMQIGQNNEYLAGDAGPAGDDKLAPPPETPDPQALQAQKVAAAAPPPMAAAPPAPAVPPVVVLAAPETAKPAPAPAAAAHPPVPVTHAVAGHALVQLAALPSEAAAMTEWQRLAKKMPGLLDGRQPTVTRTELDGKTYFRLRTGGFGDIAQATTFCEQVRAKGGGCSLAAF